MNNQGVAIVGMVLLVVVAGLSIPMLVDQSQYPATSEYVLSAGESVTVKDGLRMDVQETDDTQVVLDMVDVETRESVNLTITEGSTEPYSLPGGSGNVTVVATTNQEADLTVNYPPTYGWSEPARVVIDNIGFILLIMLLVIVGSTIAVVKP